MALFGRRKRNMEQQYAGTNTSVMIPRYTTPPERNTREWLDTFGKNPRLAVVDRIASDLSTCKGKLYRIDEVSGDEVEIQQHPFIDMMNRPNPLFEMTSGAVWRLLQIYLELKGEGYFLFEFDAVGRPVELWPMPPNWVQQTPYLGHPFYEIKSTDGQIRQIPVDDIFCMKNLNPLDPYKRGLGAAEALADEIETDEYAAKFQKKFFYNDATPALLITAPGIQSNQRQRFYEQWNAKYQGPFNSHKIAVLDGEVTVTKLAENMRDMDMMQGREFLRNAVLEHFGVPREIMGITENSNRATADAAQYIYAQNVLTPRLKRREEAINTQILPFYGEGLVWHFDDIVPHSQEFDKGVALDGWNAGLLTKNEARELIGQEPCKTGGNVYKTTLSDIFLHDTEDPAEISSDLLAEPAGGGAGDAGDELGDVSIMGNSHAGREEKTRRQTLIRLMEAAEKEQRGKFEAATLRYFRQQEKRISASLHGTEKADWSVWDILKPYIEKTSVASGFIDTSAWEALGEQGQHDLLASFVGGIIDWTVEEKDLESVFKPLWSQSYDAGTKLAERLYNIRGVQRPELLSHAKMHGGQRIQNVTQTTKDNIARIVADGIEAGIGREKMADEILQEYEIQSRSRARLIARQETITSLETGHYDMMRTSGARTKTWRHRPQKNPRQNHVRLEGTTIPIDEWFNLGNGVKMRFPCDPDAIGDSKAVAAETIECGCYVTYNW